MSSKYQLIFKRDALKFLSKKVMIFKKKSLLELKDYNPHHLQAILKE